MPKRKRVQKDPPYNSKSESKPTPKKAKPTPSSTRQPQTPKTKKALKTLSTFNSNIKAIKERAFASQLAKTTPARLEKQRVDLETIKTARAPLDHAVRYYEQAKGVERERLAEVAEADVALSKVSSALDWDDNAKMPDKQWDALNKYNELYPAREAAWRAVDAAREVVSTRKGEALKEKAKLQALIASLGHPAAVQQSGWTILDEEEKKKFYGDLEAEIHSDIVLMSSTYPMYNTFAPLPDYEAATPKKRVVALDCEFVDSHSGRSMLAQTCMIDALTGEVLLDVLVEPEGEIVNYVTQFSGLTKATYDEYRERGLILPDIKAVQEAIFKHIDQSTIMIGFALENDLKKLKISHGRVVDPQIVAKKAVHAVGGSGTRYRLRDMCAGILGRTVQGDDLFGHDCVEDCFSPRELMIWWLDENNKKDRDDWIDEKAGVASGGGDGGGAVEYLGTC